MKTKKILVIISLLTLPHFTFAEVEINEIMYDLSGSDSGREWIEVYNSGSVEVDISGLKFLESASASNHGLTIIKGSKNIPARGFAVIVSDSAKFLLDWPDFSGNLFKASFSSLNNTSGTLILKNNDSVSINEVAYNSSMGANGDGNSLQKNSSGWISSTPTPGAQNNFVGTASTTAITETPNSTSTPSATIVNTNSASNSTHSSPVQISNSIPKVTFEVAAGRDRLTAVGNKLIFQANLVKNDGVSPNTIYYSWSFGDGTTTQGKNVSHQYYFPGDYVVILNAVSSDLESVSRVNIKVIEPKVTIKKITGGVEIWNRSEAEINIGGWTMQGLKSFEFPKDTILPINKKVVFPDAVTGHMSGDGQILNPLGLVVGTFSNSVVTENNPLSIATTTTQSEIALLESKLENARNELAKIYDKETVYKPAPLIVVSPEMADLVGEKEKKSANNGDMSANVATVFVAEKREGTLSRVFSWPIRGMNWVTRLFVEE